MVFNHRMTTTPNGPTTESGLPIRDPGATLRGRCSSCRHWEDTNIDETDSRTATGWGVCNLVSQLDPEERFRGPRERTVLAYTQDASDYRSWLCTRSDFGCALWAAQP